MRRSRGSIAGSPTSPPSAFPRGSRSSPCPSAVLVIVAELDVEALAAVGAAVGDDVAGLPAVVGRLVREEVRRAEAIDTRDRGPNVHRAERIRRATVHSMRVVAGSARGRR